MVKKRIEVPSYRRKGKRVEGYVARRKYRKKPIKRTRLKARTAKRTPTGQFA